MAFIEEGDEVIVFEPFFDQYISNIEMPGGKIVYVPMHPPKDGAVKTLSAGEWTIDFDQLEKAISPRTKMLVLNTPRMSLPSSCPIYSSHIICGFILTECAGCAVCR